MTLLFLHTNACVVNNEGLLTFLQKSLNKCNIKWCFIKFNCYYLYGDAIKLYICSLSVSLLWCFFGMHEVPAIIIEYRFRKWQIFLFFNGFLFQLGSTYKILPYLKIRIKFFLIFITSFKQSCHFESQRLTIVGLVIVFWHSFLNNISWK